MKHRYTQILLLILILTALLVSGCAKTIEEVTSDKSYVGKTVTLKGTAQGVTKIGDLSGYTLIDENNDKIIVGSKDLPAEGDTVTIRGILEQGPLGIGYFVNVE